MTISVHLDSLAADGAALPASQTGESPPECVPASAHCVSVGVAKQFSAHSASLTARINHGLQVLSEGGAAIQNAAATLRAADESGAAVIAGKASTGEAVSAPPTPASVPAPVLHGIPPMPPLVPMPGEVHAAALHSGLGSVGLRAFRDYWLRQAATLDNIAADTSHVSTLTAAHWIDGHQQASGNIAVNAAWWSDMAGQARVLASAASDAADNHDQTVAATPHPAKDFLPAHNRLDQAIQANTASHGLLSSQVSAAAAQLAQLQGQATDAATAHHTASSAIMNAIPGPGPVAPPIATGGSSGPPACQGGTGNGNQNTGAANQNTGTANQGTGAATSAQTGLIPGLTGAGASAGTGAGSTDQMAQSMLPMLSMLPMMAMAPMSALSGLSGLSQNNPSNMAARTAGWPTGTAADAGLPGDLGDTLPAGGGGDFGAEAGGGVAQALPMSSLAGPSAPAPSGASGPATSVGISAEAAGTSPASAPGGGMSTYPPMMGAPGMGDAGPQRNVRLFPDRRMVWRPVPNTEAVFGELQRERRPRGKRATPEPTPEEGASEG